MFRRATGLLARPIISSARARTRPFSTDLPATETGDSNFIEAWKKVIPNIDPPKTPLAFMKPRPATPSSIPTKLTVNFVLPYASELASKEVDMIIIPATTGLMGVLPGHVATIKKKKKKKKNPATSARSRD
ncbi:atp synthase subunit delta' [Quercus suber]|uniref:Atp synthase subunit delta n=1 Tax=Quercus suber TaxID=58331 RepID=A0AAW0M061_QUESU